MINISIQFFGGRGGGGSGGARGGGRSGGGAAGASEQTWDSSHTARQDFYDAGNFKDLTATDFNKNMDKVQGAPVGSTARIRYADKTETYVRKTSGTGWTADTGRTMTNNDVASAAYATTDSKGEAKFDKLYQGNYKLVEVETNPKYILNKAEFDVNVEYNKSSSVSVENEHKKGNIKVYKIDKDNNRVVLGNVEFDLSLGQTEDGKGCFSCCQWSRAGV